jgi:hypothetical protein
MVDPEQDDPQEEREQDSVLSEQEDVIQEHEEELEEDSYADNSSASSVNLNESEVQNLNVVNIDLTREEDARFVCPHCFTELDGNRYGKIVCSHCGNKVFRLSNIPVWEHATIDPLETKEYKKIRSHIRNKLRDRNYLAAYKYCLQAEAIAPAEVSTWEDFALTQFLLEITKEKSKRKPVRFIIKSVKAHLEKSKDYGIEPDKYEILSGDIANKLFYIQKARVNSLRAQYKDELKYENWSPANLNYLRSLLNSFELSYSLYQDTLFLEEYVEELAKPYKWIVQTRDGELISTPACGMFNAVNKYHELTSKIRKQKPDYQPPEIQIERIGNIEITDLAEEQSFTAAQNASYGSGIGPITIE